MLPGGEGYQSVIDRTASESESTENFWELPGNLGSQEQGLLELLTEHSGNICGHNPQITWQTSQHRIRFRQRVAREGDGSTVQPTENVGMGRVGPHEQRHSNAGI